MVELVSESLNTMIRLASSTSTDNFSETKIFFIAPKRASLSDFDLTELNYYFLNIVDKIKKAGALEKISIDVETLSKYRNYF